MHARIGKFNSFNFIYCIESNIIIAKIQILLERFKNLKNPCLDIDGKNWYLFQFYHNEIELILQIYEAEKNETPIPRGYPPFAGKIAWSRHLYK